MWYMDRKKECASLISSPGVLDCCSIFFMETTEVFSYCCLSGVGGRKGDVRGLLSRLFSLNCLP